MLRHFLNPPNWFTSANLFCGFLAIITLFNGDDFVKAASLIIFGAIFDLLDGRIARITKTATPFGVQLDSFADLITFGFAPAILFWKWALVDLGLIGLIGAFFFALAGAYRLSRFNLDATTHSILEADPESTGLTITISGVTLSLIILTFEAAQIPTLSAYKASLVVIIFGLLMVSSVKYRTFKDLRLSPITFGLLAILSATCITAGLIWHFSLSFLAIALAYVLSGPMEGSVRFSYEHRPKKKAPKKHY